MKQVKNLLVTQKELLDIKGREIMAVNKEMQRLGKEGGERLNQMKMELGIPEKDLHLWQIDSAAQRFIGPDMPDPKKTIPGRDSRKETEKSDEKEVDSKEKYIKETDIKETDIKETDIKETEVVNEKKVLPETK